MFHRAIQSYEGRSHRSTLLPGHFPDRGGGVTSLSAIAEGVRRHDPDRFLTALFAPAERRDVLMLLYAFNHELARAREVASQPLLALLRLQWWREVVEGERRHHELADPLADALAAGRLARHDLLAMLDGRELEAEAAPATLADFQHLVRATAGSLAVAAGRALGGSGPVLERLGKLGAAYGVAGQVRSVEALARQGRCLLPADVLQQVGLSPEALIAHPRDPAVLGVLRVLAGWGETLLREAGGSLPRATLAAGLPAVLARRDLRHLGQPAGPRGLGDRMAVVRGAALGRV